MWDKELAEKLPTYLQEKWLNDGSKYKEQHRTTFPSFSFFVGFVNHQAKAQNDPNFIVSSNSQPYSISEGSPFKPSGFKTALAVYKTDVSATAGTGHTTVSVNDSTQYCPVHKKAHLLEKCRSFRLKHCKNEKLS